MMNEDDPFPSPENPEKSPQFDDFSDKLMEAVKRAVGAENAPGASPRTATYGEFSNTTKEPIKIEGWQDLLRKLDDLEEAIDRIGAAMQNGGR